MAQDIEPLGIGMIGCGTVGGGVARLLDEQAPLYEKRLGRAIELRRVLVRDARKARRAGAVDPAIITSDVEAFFAAQGIDIVIEVAGGVDPVGTLVRRALESKRHVVTANKALLAQQGPELFALAREHGVCVAFEASCAAGIPCINALQSGLMANDVRGLYGILNGTCNYILTKMTRDGQTYADALARAKEKGYAEADESLDVSGRDAAQKLAILASLAFGRRIVGDDVPCIGIENLDLEDIRFGSELGYDIKLLALAERWPGEEWIALSTRPCFVHKEDLLAKVAGSYNALSVHGHAVGHTMFYGRGAGAMPTASAVVSDMLGVACGAYPALFANMTLTPDCNPPARLVEWADVESRFYLRMNAIDLPGVMAKLTRILGERGISLSAVLQHEANAGELVPVVITTHMAVQGDVEQAVEEIAKLDEIEGQPVVIRIVDLDGEKHLAQRQPV